MQAHSDTLRKIIHLDMDCFYAAVEIRERPELKGKPVAVGGGSQRGVICTCNYVARGSGVRSAMPGYRARELCPDLIFLPVRHELYRRESDGIRLILSDYTPLVEPLSLDEAYLDVTNCNRYAWDIAKEIRTRILQSTGLTASAGVAGNKMLAKIASAWRKPNSQFAITPDMVPEFMRNLPVGRIPGVGPKAVARLEGLQIKTCGELQGVTSVELASRFGKWGLELYHLCRGKDARPVVPGRPRKSLSTERTLAENLRSPDECKKFLIALLADLRSDLAQEAGDREIRSCFVKVKFSDFTLRARETSASNPTDDIFCALLDKALENETRSVRLLGVGCHFADETSQKELQSTFPFAGKNPSTPETN